MDRFPNLRMFTVIVLCKAFTISKAFRALKTSVSNCARRGVCSSNSVNTRNAP